MSPHNLSGTRIEEMTINAEYNEHALQSGAHAQQTTERYDQQ